MHKRQSQVITAMRSVSLLRQWLCHRGVVLSVVGSLFLVLFYKYDAINQQVSSLADSVVSGTKSEAQFGRHRVMDEKFNLLDDDDPLLTTPYVAGTDCSLSLINSQRMPQNHPCVIDIIRRRYLYPVVDDVVGYKLQHPEVVDPSKGQAARWRQYFGNQTNGFFIECGALDGEFDSNTLHMERYLNWTGILIEPNRESFATLLTRNRKANLLPVCLSVEPYPIRVRFNMVFAIGTINQPNITDPIEMERKMGKMTTIQCFPLYSILLAVGRTDVDFFSFDVEGYELKILDTIPWHKVNIRSMTIENHYVGKKNLTDRLLPKGYRVFDETVLKNHADLMFEKIA